MKNEQKINKENIEKKNSIIKSSSKKTTKKTSIEKDNNTFIFVLFGIIIILVLFFPKIYNYMEKLSLPQIENQKTNETIEKEVIVEDALDSVHRPLMRSSIYDINTYYSLSEFRVSDMSNNDILLNAFLDLHEGNIINSTISGSCTTTPKQFNSNYIDLRIKNILGKDINYSYDSFFVPEDSSSSYSGEWIYNGSNNIFTYNGICSSKVNSVKYYNLEQLIKAEYDNKDIIAYYYVGFAKLENNNYIIYSDPEMTKELAKGNINDSSALNSIFEKLNNKDKKMYKYVYKNTLCSYNEYCLYKGEWVNEL